MYGACRDDEFVPRQVILGAVGIHFEPPVTAVLALGQQVSPVAQDQLIRVHHVLVEAVRVAYVQLRTAGKEHLDMELHLSSFFLPS